MNRRTFLITLAVALPGRRTVKNHRFYWNRFADAYNRNHKDLKDIEDSFQEIKSEAQVSVDMIRGVNRADRSMKKAKDAWNEFKATI